MLEFDIYTAQWKVCIDVGFSTPFIFMLGAYKGRTDGQTDGQTDEQEP